MKMSFNVVHSDITTLRKVVMAFLALRLNYFLSTGMNEAGQVGVTVRGGGPNQAYRLQGAPDLSTSNWVDLVTLTNTGSPTNWVDLGATNYPRRFYRVVSP